MRAVYFLIFMILASVPMANAAEEIPADSCTEAERSLPQAEAEYEGLGALLSALDAADAEGILTYEERISQLNLNIIRAEYNIEMMELRQALIMCQLVRELGIGE